MVSPGKLQLLAELADGTTETFDPTVDTGSGDLRYRGAEQFLYERDGHAANVLEELAQWGLLTKTFQEKVFLCPSCGSDELRFTTACPSCDSLHIVETEVVHHTQCNHIAPKDQFASDGDVDVYICPNCDASVNVPDGQGNVLEEIEIVQQYVCRDCSEHVSAPEARLQCQQCPPIAPSEAIERVLYQYSISDTGETWLERQLSARRTVGEILTDRGFETRVNTTVNTDTNGEIPVHIYAEDELLDRRIIVIIDEHPDSDDVQLLQSAATAADARAILLTTTGTVTDHAAEAARTSDIELFSWQSDDSLEKEYEVTEEWDNTQPFLQRITSAWSETMAGER